MDESDGIIESDSKLSRPVRVTGQEITEAGLFCDLNHSNGSVSVKEKVVPRLFALYSWKAVRAFLFYNSQHVVQTLAQ